MEAQVYIVGAGPAGASAALFLAKQGVPSVLIDKSSFPRDKICGDAAAYTGEGIGNAMISGMIAAEVITQNYHGKTFRGENLKAYDEHVYRRLGSELKLSQHMQSLTKYPWLFNMVVNKARKKKSFVIQYPVCLKVLMCEKG